ncbi:uncharacterized protein LOC122935506 [Bufo gargarizans]|uniref:uncharacterized protein LOC122935506 n=1 Tax=Bufo gargarizans TaxID=30331 RepID=UPI001CF4F8E6|nr:uncharacterized protein LOC122935506 [Bufo gargarizans]
MEYLFTLQGCRKWQRLNPNIQVGYLVLLKDQQAERIEWPMGLVVKSAPSDDEFNPSVVLAFVPARSCHLQFSGDHGTFSPPIFNGNFEMFLHVSTTPYHYQAQPMMPLLFDSLFEITSEIEHQDVDLRGFEKDLVKSVREKIIERMVYFPSGVNSLILKEIRWKTVYRVTLMFWLHLIQGGKEMRNFLKTQLKALESYPLGSSNAKLVSFTVEDVNECQLGMQNCHSNAHCVNMVGSYSCYCMDGYEDHSPAAPGIVCTSSKPAEIHSLSEHLEILIGAVVTACRCCGACCHHPLYCPSKETSKSEFWPARPANKRARTTCFRR